VSLAKPNIYKSWSGTKVLLWDWLEEEVGNKNGSFELDHGELAEKFDVSRTTVINALKTFISANLLRKDSSGRGRGNHSEYKLLWNFREEGEENVTPSRANKKPQEKSITKGSKTFRYYAYKFRTLVESSNLASKASVIVGKILEFLEEKPPDLFKEWLIYLKNWLQRTRSLKDFFVYFHQTLKGLAREKQKLEETRRFIENQRKQREEVREEYENNPPPKSSDYDRFSDYIEAMDEWEN